MTPRQLEGRSKEKERRDSKAGEMECMSYGETGKAMIDLEGEREGWRDGSG